MELNVERRRMRIMFVEDEALIAMILKTY